mmetsp:Transcript_74708/g.148009  ORF Transcript_74708/g.148009 Transcript_74708/m.148009 type:complete len:84 (+) Transcript_74708:301-552(+)
MRPMPFLRCFLSPPLTNRHPVPASMIVLRTRGRTDSHCGRNAVAGGGCTPAQMADGTLVATSLETKISDVPVALFIAASSTGV